MRAWVLGPLGALLMAALPGAWADLSRAEAELERGRFRLAEQAFRELMTKLPNNRVRIGLARALAHGGDCAEALALMEGLTGVRGWTIDASLAQGRCLQRQGRNWEAVEVYRLATERVPERPEPWMAAAGVLDALGETEARDEALDALLLCDRGVGLALVVRAEIGLRHGAPDGPLAQARDELGDGPALALLDGRAWMDAGDPYEAARVLGATLVHVPGHAQLGLWWVEAVRRVGDAEAAADALEGPVLKGVADDALARVIAARVLVDLGRPAEGADRLAGLVDHDWCEALASRWYLEREGPRAVELEARWRACEDSPARSLEQLVPLEER